MIDKYVNKNGGKIYSCFVDLHKALDTVPRVKLFYKLLTEYSIGGKYLKILQEIYKENKVYVKVKEGLLQPFETTIGVKQGVFFHPFYLIYSLTKLSIYLIKTVPLKTRQFRH